MYRTIEDNWILILFGLLYLFYNMYLTDISFIDNLKITIITKQLKQKFTTIPWKSTFYFNFQIQLNLQLLEIHYYFNKKQNKHT